MSRKKITVEYVRAVVGHPEPGSVVRVELTPAVQAVLDLGFAVQVADDEDEVAVEDGVPVDQ